MSENPFAPPETEPEVARLYSGRNPMDDCAACPKCGARNASPMPYDPSRGRAGPRAMDHVRCDDCLAQYDGYTGGEIGWKIALNIYLPLAVLGVIIALIVFGLAV